MSDLAKCILMAFCCSCAAGWILWEVTRYA